MPELVADHATDDAADHGRRAWTVVAHITVRLMVDHRLVPALLLVRRFFDHPDQRFDPHHVGPVINRFDILAPALRKRGSRQRQRQQYGGIQYKDGRHAHRGSPATWPLWL